MKISGSVRNPKVGKMDFLDKIIKEIIEREAKKAIKDVLLKNLIKDDGKKKKKKGPDVEDLIKGIFDALK